MDLSISTMRRKNSGICLWYWILSGFYWSPCDLLGVIFDITISIYLSDCLIPHLFTLLFFFYLPPSSSPFQFLSPPQGRTSCLVPWECLDVPLRSQGHRYQGARCGLSSLLLLLLLARLPAVQQGRNATEVQLQRCSWFVHCSRCYWRISSAPWWNVFEMFFFFWALLARWAAWRLSFYLSVCFWLFVILLIVIAVVGFVAIVLFCWFYGCSRSAFVPILVFYLLLSLLVWFMF